MIPRLLVTAGAVVPVAARAIAADRGATVATSTPTIWVVLGCPFEAGSMIAALCACFAVRFYIVQRDYKVHRWSLDAPISALALMFTAGAVLRLRPDPIGGLIYGTVLGVTGANILAIAKRNADRIFAAFGLLSDADSPAPPAPPAA